MMFMIKNLSNWYKIIFMYNKLLLLMKSMNVNYKTKKKKRKRLYFNSI